jgi:hypothetical protein
MTIIARKTVVGPSGPIIVSMGCTGARLRCTITVPTTWGSDPIVSMVAFDRKAEAIAYLRQIGAEFPRQFRCEAGLPRHILRDVPKKGWVA